MEMIQFVRLPLIVMAIAAPFSFAACVIPLRGGQDGETQAKESDALDRRLTRCRAVTPDQRNAFDQCRQIWAESRRRFLGQDRSSPIGPGAEVFDGSSISRPK